MNEERDGPLLPALFALNMLVGTPEGDTYTESEVRAWMTEAGFAAPSTGRTRRSARA